MVTAREKGSMAHDRERRRHRRYPVSKAVRIRSGTREQAGRVGDISAGGAAIRPRADFDLGSEVEVEIEDFGIFQGHVARVSDDDDMFGIEFDIGQDEEDALMSEITRMHDDILREEF